MRGAFSVALLLALAAVVTLAWMAWQSPEIRDVPATVTPTVRVIMLPTATSASLSTPTVTVTPMPAVIDFLPRETATRVPTSTQPPAATVAPTVDRAPVQKG